MMLHTYVTQFILATLMVVVFPVYFAYSTEWVAPDKPASQPVEVAPVDVAIEKFKFVPQEITVTPGTTIRWTNREKRQYHNVWFEKSGEQEPDYLFPDDTYDKTFNEPGTFPYRCGPHPKMMGVVYVKSS